MLAQKYNKKNGKKTRRQENVVKLFMHDNPIYL